MVTRLENWPKALSAVLRQRAAMPFQWGVNDCLMFPADVVRALTSFDPGERWRGKYHDEAGAMEIVREFGGVRELITAGIGFEPSEKIFAAGRGDIVMFDTEQGMMGGVVDDSGERIAVPLSNRETLVRFPLGKALCVWKY